MRASCGSLMFPWPGLPCRLRLGAAAIPRHDSHVPGGGVRRPRSLHQWWRRCASPGAGWHRTHLHLPPLSAGPVHGWIGHIPLVYCTKRSTVFQSAHGTGCVGMHVLAWSFKAPVSSRCSSSRLPRTSCSPPPLLPTSSPPTSCPLAPPPTPPLSFSFCRVGAVWPISHALLSL